LVRDNSTWKLGDMSDLHAYRDSWKGIPTSYGLKAGVRKNIALTKGVVKNCPGKKTGKKSELRSSLLLVASFKILSNQNVAWTEFLTPPNVKIRGKNRTKKRYSKNDSSTTTTNNMPRTSRKILFLGSLTKALNKRLQQRALRTINDDEDSFADAVDLSVAMAIKKGFTRRYLFRK
jgi:hypothetical protein